jgi:hypothetical protein
MAFLRNDMCLASTDHLINILLQPGVNDTGGAQPLQRFFVTE